MVSSARGVSGGGRYSSVCLNTEESTGNVLSGRRKRDNASRRTLHFCRACRSDGCVRGQPASPENRYRYAVYRQQPARSGTGHGWDDRASVAAVARNETGFFRRRTIDRARAAKKSAAGMTAWIAGREGSSIRGSAVGLADGRRLLPARGGWNRPACRCRGCLYRLTERRLAPVRPRRFVALMPSCD